MKRKKYWAVAYGTTIRWAGPCNTAAQAAQEAFGLVDTKQMTVKESPKNPPYLSQKARKEFLMALIKRHEEKTGNKVK